MNKKAGSPRELIQWIGYLIVTIIIIVFVFAVTYNNLNLKIDTTEIQHKIIASNIIYSPSCLAYEDQNLGVQVGKIDQDKITDYRLEKCLSKSKTGYKVSLLDYAGKIIKEADNIDQAMEMQIPVCKISDSFKCSKGYIPILYNDKQIFSQGYLVIEVVTNV